MENKEAHKLFDCFKRIADEFNEHRFDDYTRAERNAVRLILKDVEQLFSFLRYKEPDNISVEYAQIDLDKMIKKLSSINIHSLHF